MSVLAMALMAAFSSVKRIADPGEVIFENTTNKAITISWTVPGLVTDISMVLVGGSYGDGSATSFSSLFRAFSGNQISGTYREAGGTYQILAAASTYTSAGGGNGGDGGQGYAYWNSGYNQGGMNTAAGGGAGGYTGSGGRGANGIVNSSGNSSAYGGGGVGLYGQGTSGTGLVGNGNSGSAGSGGAAGGGCTYSGGTVTGNNRGSGGANGAQNAAGLYGGGRCGLLSGLYIYGSDVEMESARPSWNGKGGGALLWVNNFKVSAGTVYTLTIARGGAIRILWGGTRSFPNNAAAI